MSAQAESQSLEHILLFEMFKGDLEIAAQFARINHFAAAREHLAAALKKLEQLQALPGSDQILIPEQAPINV